MNKESFKQILTLRYDTTLDTTLSELKWEDFYQKDKINKKDYSIIETSIRDEISKHLHGTSKTSISLSSGIDSTLVGTILKRHFPDVKVDSLSLTFSNSYDESPFAQKIADRLDFNHHVIYIENFLEELPKIISVVQKPFWDLHWYYIAKKQRDIQKNFFQVMVVMSYLVGMYSDIKNIFH